MVSGQHSAFMGRGRATADKTSIAIDSINGGNYPAGAFSIGYGGETIGADGRPGTSYGVNKPNDQVYNNGPSGVINDDFGHGQTGNNGYDQTGYQPVYPNVEGYRPPGQNYNNRPYDYNDYQQQNGIPPVSNSANRNRYYNSIVRFLLGWF